MDIKRPWSVPVGWDTTRPDTTRAWSMPIEWEVEWLNTEAHRGNQISRPNSAPPLERGDKTKNTEGSGTNNTWKMIMKEHEHEASSTSSRKLSGLVATPSAPQLNESDTSKKAHRGRRGGRCKKNERNISCDNNRQLVVSKKILKRPVPLSENLVTTKRGHPLRTIPSIMPTLQRPPTLSDRRDTKYIPPVRESGALSTYKLDIPNTQSYTVVDHSLVHVISKQRDNIEPHSPAAEVARYSRIQAIFQEHEIYCSTLKSLVKSWPPDLPEIPDGAIELQVFTAPCVVTQLHLLVISDNLKLSAGYGKHNKVFEFVGRKILDAVVTSALYDWYPKLSVNQLEEMRRELVSPKYILAFSKLYSLGDRLLRARNSPPEQGLEEVFRAYVGGLCTACGWEPVNLWIRQLLRPLVEVVATQCIESSEDKKRPKKQKQGRKEKVADHNGRDHHSENVGEHEVGKDRWYSRLIYRLSLGYLSHEI